ncbi:hypothetical protein FISHEDRAFT_74644 [Fistulina hepatica ATCC 64428]|uniref:C3H1-type domain-containing protein n=1 Tax=Fistulina hepatica ATCC 64428 TaxID=1128425 RepID=A0A0D7A8X3_9AGAR|nr:hypothetical protein FISHEDRAFT_74644 [Fistulina hepatica ATCC 64428]
MSSPHEADDDPQPSAGVQTEAIAACESVVERFRTGDILKARAIVEIQCHIPYSGKSDDDGQLAAHSTAIESFLRKLDGFECIRGVAGAQVNEGEVERSTLGREGSIPRESEQEETAGRTLKRTRAGSEEEDADDVLPAAKKLDVARLPWNSRKQSRIVKSTALPPAASGADARISSILRTVEILETISVDLKRAKINLLLSLDVPQFPDSQWTKLLGGGAVDFDQVLSGLYSAADVERTTERVGGLELSYVSTTPTKRVTTFGDWTTAYDSFAEAFTFVFPHRAEELRAYALHIKAFFKARPISEHSGVIAYDSAVRTRVGQRRNLLHTDFLEFQDLQIRFIFSPTGSASGSSTRSPDSGNPLTGGKRRQSRTPCRNYNNGVCPRSSTTCFYAHVCNKCRARGHVEKSCEKNASEEETPPKKESLADTSLTMKPVPTPPVKVLANPAAVATITNFPHLFPIVTPVDVPNFEDLLRDHPNRPLVNSVCRSLREGFWPWASTAHGDYPDTYDNAEGYRTLTDPVQLAFTRQQCASEIAAGRFSPSFRPNLLPGMYAVPIWVVPKPHSDGLRLVVDHSAGKFSLNSMIPKSERSVHLDGLQQLGQTLISARMRYPHRPIVVWKSDVSHAYRILPMHPFWQIKQTIHIDDTRHVDFDNDFGGGGSGRIWSVFFVLVLWIATYVKFILDLFAYVDDTFSWDFADNLAWYEPYQEWYPKKQVTLLRLWDRIGIPHEKKKQEWGFAVIVIGLLVNTNDMSVMMPDQSRLELIAALRAFAIPGQRRSLIEFQRLGGWINWALNVYPLLRPGLNTLYAKTKDKNQPLQPVWVSKALCSELHWVIDHLEASTGIHMLQSRRWGPRDADLIVYTDASLAAISFYIPALHAGFQCGTNLITLPHGISQDRIFYFEALAVVSSIYQYRRYLQLSSCPPTLQPPSYYHCPPSDAY